MNKKLSAKVFLVLMFAFFALQGIFVAAPAEEGGGKKAGVLQKRQGANGPDITSLTINRFWFQISKEGRGVDKPDAGYYPKGTANAIYADGLVWAGKVTPADGQTVRVGGNTYNTGTTAGAIINGVPENPNGDNVYIYRIRRDYKTIYNEYKSDKSKIAIKQDAADSKGVPISDITDQDIEDLYKQYDTDWNNWPVDRGAPYIDKNGNGKYDGPTVDEPGIAGADQVLWTVANDYEPSAVSNLYKSRPIGIEQQLTVWGYARNDALGDVIFKKYRLINRGTLRVDSMFVAQWSDPDLGNYGDDLAGSDPSLSLGFVYNGNPIDGEYAKFNLPPAAVGYDFFQGPLVKSSDPNKVGIFDLKYRPGYENLGMTSFGYFSAGSTISDPTLGSRADGTYENGTLNWWKLIRGFVPQLGPDKPFYDNKGEPTLYTLSGDPITRIGWVDGGPPSFPPGDRRITLNSGPFEFAPADTQEVVVAVIGGVGADRLSSFAVMRYNDRFAQNAYNVLFNLPKPPAKVPVAMTELDREVVLEWGSDLAKVQALERDVQPGGYAFEGYQVYQLPRGDAPLKEGKLIATFDKANQIGLIFDDIFDPVSNQVIKYPVINGPDLGLKRSISIKTDALRGGEPLANNQPYYFAVTAYSYSSLESATPKTLESDPVRFTAYPKQTFGTRFQSEYGKAVSVTHSVGVADATFEVKVVNPAAVTGNDYEVTVTSKDSIYINADLDDATGVDGKETKVPNPKWNVVNKTKNTTVISENSSYTDVPDNVVIGDGLQFKMLASPFWIAGQEIAKVTYTPSGNNNITGVNWGGSQMGGGLDVGYYFFGSSLLPYQVSKDVEIRFNSTKTSKGYLYNRPGYAYQGYFDSPIQIFDVTDPAKPRQLQYMFVEQVGSAFQDKKWTPGGASSDREYLFILNDTYSETPNQVYASGRVLSNAPEWPILYAMWPVLKDKTKPAFKDGDVLKIKATQLITTADKFTFSTAAVAQVKNSTLAAADVEKINVFPNPYYGFSRIETSRFNRFVTFTNLPPNQKVTIRIFNLAGQHVRTLEKDDAQQILRWDLRNEANMPAASGMYVVFVDLPGIGKTKTLKVAIIQEQEVLDVF